MVNNILAQKNTIKRLIVNDRNFNIPQFVWDFMENFATTFRPVSEMTRKIQAQQLSMGDFYIEWLTCEYRIKNINNSIAPILLKNMDIRKELLFENNIFKSAIFLDPRINFQNSPYINESIRKDAEVNIIRSNFRFFANMIFLFILYFQEKLMTTWHHFVQNFRPDLADIREENSPQEGSLSTIEGSHRSIFDIMTIQHLQVESPTISMTMVQKLRDLSNRTYEAGVTSVFEYWEKFKIREPKLYALSQIALAAPATQVSVERAFSALSVMMSKKRSRLDKEVLNDLLLCKINSEIFYKLDLEYTDVNDL
jgi:hypothetical protein